MTKNDQKTAKSGPKIGPKIGSKIDPKIDQIGAQVTRRGSKTDLKNSQMVKLWGNRLQNSGNRPEISSFSKSAQKSRPKKSVFWWFLEAKFDRNPGSRFVTQLLGMLHGFFCLSERCEIKLFFSIQF